MKGILKEERLGKDRFVVNLEVFFWPVKKTGSSVVMIERWSMGCSSGVVRQACAIHTVDRFMTRYVSSVDIQVYTSMTFHFMLPRSFLGSVPNVFLQISHRQCHHLPSACTLLNVFNLLIHLFFASHLHDFFQPWKGSRILPVFYLVLLSTL